MKKTVWYSIIVIVLLMTTTGLLGRLYMVNRKLVSPLPKGFTPTIVKVVEATSGDPIVDEISRVFKKEGTRVVGRAISCFYSESKLNTLAYNFNSNGTADVGVAQINDVHGMTIEDRQDFKKNIKKAYELYKKYGWKPWYSKECKGI